MLCVTDVYLRDITITFSLVLPLNASHLSICSSFFSSLFCLNQIRLCLVVWCHFWWLCDTWWCRYIFFIDNNFQSFNVWISVSILWAWLCVAKLLGLSVCLIKNRKRHIILNWKFCQMYVEFRLAVMDGGWALLLVV